MVEPTPAEDRARADAADVRAHNADDRAVVSEHRAAVAAARPGWSWWLAMVLTAVLGPAIAIGISAYKQRQSEQAWCEVIVVLDDGYRQPAPGAPALSERGQRIARGIAKVRSTYHCPPT